MISLSINGITRQLDSPISVSGLIELMQLGNKRIAIECNGEIVPRGKYSVHTLQEGDNVEIVVAVGGG